MRSNRTLRQNRKFERQPNLSNLDHNPEWSKDSTRSRNTGRHRNNLILDMENLKEGGKEDTEDR